MSKKSTLQVTLCSVIFFVCIFTGYAQSDDTTEAENEAAQMPQAASVDAVAMGNNINTSLDYYTGTANVSIPIHTISYKGIQVPVSLNYRASGIRVEGIASEVGLGWELSAGGSVRRMMMGGPDEGRMLRERHVQSQGNQYLGRKISRIT